MGFANNCDAKMADAKLTGELTEKAEIKDMTPREPLEIVRARVEAARARAKRE